MINVMPLGDEQEHEHTALCWCKPRVEWQDYRTGEIWANGPTVTHNSADCRELVERLLGEGCGQHQRWAVYET